MKESLKRKILQILKRNKIEKPIKETGKEILEKAFPNIAIVIKKIEEE